MLLLLTYLFYFISATNPPTEFDDAESNAEQDDLDKTITYMNISIQDLKNAFPDKYYLEKQIKKIEKDIEIKKKELVVLNTNLEEDKYFLCSFMFFRRKREIAEKENEIEILEKTKQVKIDKKERLKAEEEAKLGTKNR